jgi:DNA-directed RNA polymerase
MQTFTGTQYLKIDVANGFGLDRLTWADRMHWFDNNEPDLESITHLAKNPLLFEKGVRAWRQTQKGEQTNHIMGLDATASGLQIMAFLSNCLETAKATNLINTGRRRCVYNTVARTMQDHGVQDATRDVLKKPVMTVFYGSKAQPKAIFGEETPELFAFYDSLQEKLPGAYELMDILQSYWRKDQEYHSWRLPDGHVARVPVIATDEKKLEIDECNHIRVTYRARRPAKVNFSRALAANIVHSIDGFVVRQMVAAAKSQGFWLAPIHDCFFTHPNYMNQVRENYIKIMTWIASKNILQDILRDIAGYKVGYRPPNTGLHKHIPDSEYALS